MRHKFFSIILTILLAALAAPAQPDEPIRARTDLVTVNVAVYNEEGKFVPGLTAGQFEIFDDREKQSIAYFSGEEAPISYAVVYDMHPTTEANTAAVLDSLRAFAKELGAEDRFLLVAFNERGSLNLDFVPTAEQLRDSLKRAEPRSLYDAIYLAAERLRASRNLKRTLLVISDSADHQSRRAFADVTRLLKTFDVQVYAVIFDESQMWRYSDLTGGKPRPRIYDNATPLERAALEDLTLKNGGTANFPTSGSGLELYQIYRRVDAEMRRFYSLSFYPAEANGKWHDLRIGLRAVKGSKKFALTYRLGYQSAAPNR